MTDFTNPAETAVAAFDDWKATRPDLGAVTMDVSVDDYDISLDNLTCSDPGRGLAKECMAKLSQLADEHGVTVKGAAWGQLGTGTPEERFRQLKQWYERCGFVVDYDPDVNFICRAPREPEPDNTRRP